MQSSSRLITLAIAVAITPITLVTMVSWPIGLSIMSAENGMAPNQPTGFTAEAGDTQVKLSWDDPQDTSITSYRLWQIAESAKLTADVDDEFGYSVAVVGNEAVVGMPEDDDTNADSGAVFLFTRDLDSGAWTQTAKLKASDAAQDDGFGKSVAFNGETIVVGAPGKDHDSLKIDAGAAYVFTKPGTGWANSPGTETAKLTAPDAAADDEFGWNAVAVDGNTIVVGAYAHADTKGAVYVFAKPDTDDGWEDWDDLPQTAQTDDAEDKDGLTAKLTAEGAQDGDYFGNSVAVDENTVVVGASGDDGDSETADFMGSAFVFVKPGSGGWASTSAAAKLTASTRGNQDNFGRSVAIDGNTIVVGAYGTKTMVGGSQWRTGSAFVFTKPGTGWADGNETAKLTASDAGDNDEFGYSVAVDGDTVVVGAYGEAGSRGSAYVFTKPGTGWADRVEVAQLTASDRDSNHKFGSSVTVAGDTVVVGAENNDAAYVFDIVDWDDIAGAGATSHIVTGLSNLIVHTFQVRAVNTNGASAPSGSVVETPKAASYAPARPRNFSAAQTAGVGQVELTWDAHLYPLTVTGYEYTQDNAVNWTNIDGSDSSTVSHTVTGLTVGSTYTFAVRAVNSAGETASDSQSVTIIDKPAAPDSFTAVPGDGQVWLGWRSPADFTISGYQYQQGGGGWTDIPGSRAGTTFHIVTGLTNGTSYTFQVRAVNAAGGSDSSGEQSATPATASSAPSKPTNFSVEQIGVGQVELTWDASSNPLTVAKYESTRNGGISWTAISGSDSGTVSGLVTGNYNFAVRAVNDAGATASDYQLVTIVAQPGAPGGLAAGKGDTQVRLNWNEPGNASITKYQILQFPESIKLKSDDRSDNDEFGHSVAVDGHTLVIGALGDDDPNNTGAAYVFTRVAGGWTQVGKLTAAVRRIDAGFGHAVAVHGDTIVVGAYEEDHPDPNDPTNDIGDVGAAYVFTRPATGWADMTETARLTASDAAANDEFGTSVAVHGDTIVVGAPEEDAGARGSAYIFTRPANGWGNWSTLNANVKAGLTATLTGLLGGDRFGRSVAVDGDTVVVGAFEENSAKGAAYVFTKSATTGVWDDWNDKAISDATARLTASYRANGDRFGRAVAMDGDTIVVGAPYNDYDDPDNNTNDVSNSGAAYVFIKTATGGWATGTETAKLTASDRAKNDEFGYSVAVDGDTIVVGARQPSYVDDGGETIKRPGAAYLFSKPSNGWTNTAGTDKLVAYDRSGNDRFGNFVAVDGDTVLVGAVGDDSGKGSAYVFSTEWADIPGTGAGTTSHIATRLPNNFEHTFQVRAVNAAGGSDSSGEQSATPATASSAPSKPTNFTAMQTGIGQVRLTWDPISPLTVTGYQYTRDNALNWTNIDGSDSSTGSHTVRGLIAGTTYDFAVRGVNGAVNDTDKGASSDFGSVTTDARLAAPDGFNADVGDAQVKLNWDNPNDSTITKYQLLQIDLSKLTASDGLRGDLFGYSVAVDGDTAVIGAYQDDDDINGDNSGSAYVLIKDSSGWSQVVKLTASDAAANDEFGYSVAVDGDTIVVGARQDDTRNGAAYVFTKPAGGWNGDITETAKLTAYEGAANDEFGISVAVDGNTILVGAHQNDADANDNNEGVAYIFTKFGDVWGNAPVSGDQRVETAKLIASDAAADDEFGISVAVDGNTAVVGAYKDDHTDNDGNNIGDSGSACVFTKVSGVWSQKAKLIASDGAANDEFGSSVGVNGDTVVVGAYQDDDNGNQSGSAYVFTKPSSGWSNGTETAKLSASDAAADDEFGYSVAVDGDTIVIGAPYNDYDDTDGDTDDDEGAAYVFTRDSAGGWSQKAKLIASDGAAQDRYGYSVAVSGDTVLVGAYSVDNIDDGGNSIANTGAAYFLSISEWADIPDSGAGTRSYPVTGLTNGVEYTFQVRGVNAAGRGLASASASGTPQLPKPDTPSGLSAHPGDTQVTVVWKDKNDPLITTYQRLQLPQTKLTADDGATDDGFGVSVAMDGDTVVVGARGDEGNKGAAYVFTKDSSGWSQAAKLTASDGASNDEFGISVAVDGDTVVVGAHQNDADANDNNEGAAYVFTKPASGGWATDTETAKLTAFGASADDEFGISVAVDGDIVVVGAHQYDASDVVANSGAAYVFTKPANGGWATDTETAKLTAFGASADDEFGISVAVDGDIVVVGAHQYDASDVVANSGAAYVFTKPANGGWATDTEAAKLTAFGASADDEFGISVAVDGDIIVVGAHQYDTSDVVANSGAAYVFTKPAGGGWATGTETAKLTASDAAANDYFGWSVAVDENTVVVGSYLDDDGPTGIAIANSGSAYVFTRASGVWSEKLKLIASDTVGGGDYFGWSVGVAGDTVLVGALLDDDKGSDSGSAYVIDTAEWVDMLGIVVPDPDQNGSREYTYRVTDLINDQEYIYRVRAVNAAGNTPTKEIVSATPRLATPDKPEGLSAEAGDGQVELSWEHSYDPTITGYQVLRSVFSRLTASVPTAEEHFGWSVAMDDGTAVVGASGDNSKRGAAYVLIRESGRWSQAAKLTASDGAANDEFGYSVAVDDDTVVIGAPGGQNTLEDVEVRTGAAYVFTKVSGVWSQTAKLYALDGAKDDEFGHSVAVDGDIVVVGAHRYDASDVVANSGAAYVFTKPATDGGWADSDDIEDATGQVKHTETAKLTASASERTAHDRFGQSVAVHGVTVMVGVHLDDDKRGSVYVFTKPATDGGWADSDDIDDATGQVKHTETAKLAALDGETDDYFGYSVAVDGDTAVVGAQHDHAPRRDSGSAYVFTKVSDTWGQVAKLTASDGEGTDYFGTSVALNGNTVVIGAYNDDVLPEIDDDDPGNHSGSAYVFARDSEGVWSQTAKLTLPNDDGVEEDDQFGYSVAVDGVSIMVGAHQDGVEVQGNDSSGSIYVLRIPQWMDISPSDGATESHTVTGLTNGVEYTFQVRAVDEVGLGPVSDIVRATPVPAPPAPSVVVNLAPSFGGVESLTFAVDENASPGTPVGSAVTAIDPNGDILTYSLSGTHASPFGIDTSNGQIAVGFGTALDYESGLTRYTVIVSVHDSRDPYGDQDTTTDDYIEVNIDVNNIDEAGTVVVSLEQPEVGTALTATLSDPDARVTGTAWQWARSSHQADWQNIAGAVSLSYIPVDQDANKYLRVTVFYADGQGVGRKAQAVLGSPVRALPVPVATPTPTPTAVPTPTPTAVPTPTPTAVPTPTPTAVPTPTPTAVPTPTPTAVPTPTPTAVPTPTPTAVPTPTSTAVPTPTPTAVPTPTPTAVPTLTPTAVPTPTPTAVPTATLILTVTPSATSTPLAMPSPTPVPPPTTPPMAPVDDGGFKLWWAILLAVGAVAVATVVVAVGIYIIVRDRDLI